jgi:putative PIN family toxin of toxin-antitoxin system
VIRVVLDPGVLIAGVISPTGAPAALIRSWREAEFDVVVCPHLMEELSRALTYPKIRRYIPEPEAAKLTAALVRAAVVVDDPPDVPAICRDRDDDYLFALAATNAQVLVSGDRDIREAEHPPVRVLTPRGFLAILRSREGL